jgi:hypothetical protein
MPLHDINYKHWEGVHLGVWSRRWAIARNGLTACLKVRWMANLVVLCWGAGLAAAAVLFLTGQLLVADSVVVRWVATFNPICRVSPTPHVLAQGPSGHFRRDDAKCPFLLFRESGS